MPGRWVGRLVGSSSVSSQRSCSCCRLSCVTCLARGSLVLWLASFSPSVTCLPACLPTRSDPAVWREPHTSSAAGVGNELLARRGRCQLALRLPTARTNVSGEGPASLVELVGVRTVGAEPRQAQHQQPAPLGYCAAPLPPSHPGSQLTVVQQLEQLQQQQRRQYGLHASLHSHEQWHRDQLSSTAAWASTRGAVPCGWVPMPEQGLQLAAGCQWSHNIHHPQLPGWGYTARGHSLPAAAAALHGLHIASGIPAF